MNQTVLQTLRLIALLVATFVNFWIFQFSFIYGAHFIGELIDGDGQPFGLDANQNILVFGMTLSVVSIIIAYFRSLSGGLLIIISSVILISFHFAEEIGRPKWPIYLLLLSGLLLL